jgi:hypothetical protein
MIRLSAGDQCVLSHCDIIRKALADQEAAKRQSQKNVFSPERITDNEKSDISICCFLQNDVVVTFYQFTISDDNFPAIKFLL